MNELVTKFLLTTFALCGLPHMALCRVVHGLHQTHTYTYTYMRTHAFQLINYLYFHNFLFFFFSFVLCFSLFAPRFAHILGRYQFNYNCNNLKQLDNSNRSVSMTWVYPFVKLLIPFLCAIQFGCRWLSSSTALHCNCSYFCNFLECTRTLLLAAVVVYRKQFTLSVLELTVIYAFVVAFTKFTALIRREKLSKIIN